MDEGNYCDFFLELRIFKGEISFISRSCLVTSWYKNTGETSLKYILDLKSIEGLGFFLRTLVLNEKCKFDSCYWSIVTRSTSKVNTFPSLKVDLKITYGVKYHWQWVRITKSVNKQIKTHTQQKRIQIVVPTKDSLKTISSEVSL